ncbi:6258_t:CDS:1 [Cetraspora pellucida]|uniref:6258_t:CDS:1 n=1 Tax=Cetraspora pellucida TaxID=1433469 RepID=A0ACA9KG59_9GLOM|nr:6258_t:CDS:1 [Cetraspora pellucida]
MKEVLIPLFVHATDTCFDTCFDCQPGHSFRADWCLDLHGYLSREEFAARLNQINNHVKSVELMTYKTKNLLYFVASICAALLSTIFSAIMKSIGGVPIGFSISGILFFIAKYKIEKNAAGRAIAFTNLLNELFAQYNKHETPTVNWKFWWVHSYERYVTGLDGRAYGNGHINKLKMGHCLSVKFAVLFAENALIILEINDALSDLTKNTVGVNLNNNYVNNNYASNNYANNDYSNNDYANNNYANNSNNTNEMVIISNDIPVQNVPINSTGY